jgi:hypothetical protein
VHYVRVAIQILCTVQNLVIADAVFSLVHLNYFSSFHTHFVVYHMNFILAVPYVGINIISCLCLGCICLPPNNF